jgi:hypothetical protein
MVKDPGTDTQELSTVYDDTAADALEEQGWVRVDSLPPEEKRLITNPPEMDVAPVPVPVGTQTTVVDVPAADVPDVPADPGTTVTVETTTAEKTK